MATRSTTIIVSTDDTVVFYGTPNEYSKVFKVSDTIDEMIADIKSRNWNLSTAPMISEDA